MELYRSGQHELKLSKDTEIYLRQMQKEFMPEDAKVGIIQLWLDELSQDYVCSIMIYKEAFDHEYDTPKDWELKEINNVRTTVFPAGRKYHPTDLQNMAYREDGAG